MYQTRLLTKRVIPARGPQPRFMQQLTSPELRSRFIKYFEKQGHVPVKSASLVPHNDKSLLFTNAGRLIDRVKSTIDRLTHNYLSH